MGAVYGASTADGTMYKEVMDRVKKDGIEICINQVDEYQLQRVTIEASEGGSVVDARNRGGGRLALVHVEPDLDRCLKSGEGSTDRNCAVSLKWLNGDRTCRKKP